MPKTVFVVSVGIMVGLYGIIGIFSNKEDADKFVETEGGIITEIPFNVGLDVVYPIS